MIDRLKTITLFGYDPDEVSSGSRKKIVAVCDDCGAERYSPKYGYRAICTRCIRKACYLSQQTREKRVLASMGKNNPFFGRKHSEETKDKISKALLEKPLTLQPGEAARHKLIMRYKRGAAKRGIEFQLSNSEMDALFSGNCHYCGVHPQNVSTHGMGNGIFVYNGIDRMDNLMGYAMSNCVSCCQICNLAKRDMSYGDFLAWIARICNHTKGMVK